MKRSILLFTIVILGVGAAFAQPSRLEMEPQEKTLYQRLGGYDALAAVSDDFIGRLATGKLLKRFVVGLSNDWKKKLRSTLIDFLFGATVHPWQYTGRDMKTSHTGLDITEADWKESVEALVATLDKFKVPAKEKGEVLAAVSGLKKDIVEKP